ncbi:F-box domain-containing protein [Favolaschia claudopus]|uniref:F-box domain-containing protein n=1 Tax=Favolaschia claudopus TaxID=2862362 RepID=A0AAW0A9F0_9AGAR
MLRSPFPHLLHTNIVPTDAECDSIRHLLDTARQELAVLTRDLSLRSPFGGMHVPQQWGIESDFSAQDAALRISSSEDTLFKRHELEEFINQHLSLVSLGRRIPEDVLREIFMATLTFDENAMLGPYEPAILSQTCRYWRDITLTMPRLWAIIHIVVPSPLKLPHLFDAVRNWLERSGNDGPLDISLRFSPQSDDSCDLDPLMASITFLSRRWRHINLNLTSYTRLRSMTAEDVPLLESLVIKEHDHDLRYRDHYTEHLKIAEAKTLRRLELPPFRTPKNPENFTSLTYLNLSDRLGYLPYDGAISVLSHCLLLESCGLSVTGSSRFTPKHISLPRLAHLSIFHLHIPQDAQFLTAASMSLPVLRAFHCDALGRVLPNTTVRCLFPAADLACLKIGLRPLTSDTLVAGLTTLPSLEELHVLNEPRGAERRGFPDPQFLHRLMPLCPRLRCLELSQFTAISDTTILEFLRARTKLQPHFLPLSYFASTIARPRQFDILLHLADEVLDGLVVNIMYYSPYRSVPIARLKCSFEGMKMPSQ